MADLKAPPQNAWLARAAALLRSGQDTANSVTLPHVTKALPVIGALLNSGKLGEMAFGRSPEGVEQMSYGEAPITLPTLAKPMGFPKNEEGGLRAIDQLEGLGTMPSAGPLTASAKGAGSLAIIAPYIRGPKGLPGFQTPTFEKAAAEAVRLLRKGDKPSAVGQETGMWVVPRGGNRYKLDKMDPDNAMFMVEIPDSKMQFKPGFQGIYGPASSNIEGTWKLPEVIDFKNGFKLAPHLENMQVSLNPKLGSAGAYNFPTGTIKLNPSQAGSSEELLGYLNHELQHGLQYHTNDLSKLELSMPPGGSPGEWAGLNKNNMIQVGDILDNLDDTKLEGVPREIKGLGSFLRSYKRGLVDPTRGYNRLLGEQQAEASRKRMRLTIGERQDRTPYEDYTMGHPFKGSEGLDMQDVHQADQLFTQQPYVDDADYIQHLLQILRKDRNPLK